MDPDRLERLRRDGVVVHAPSTIVVEHEVEIGAGSVLWPGVVLRGQTRLGRNVEVQSGCWIVDCTIGDDVVIKPHSVCTGATIGDRVAVGPMAHLREGTVLEAEVKIGNFVEVKKTVVHQGAKASHLTYLGDAEIGAGANIGAGTITCNYDGFGKHRTSIGANAFIGSNTALVAPVEVGDDAIVGAGSVITRTVPANALAVERAPQKTFEDRAGRIRERNKKRAGK